MGMFDGVIQQGQQMIDKEMTTTVRPMFDALRGDLQALRQSADAGTAGDAQLGAHLDALDAHLVATNHLMQANNANLHALVQKLIALNAHPAIAARAPAR